ncbi:HAMP domain-containing sensor histidine kinase [Bacillaceae bacterium IKA-2]|nr:HAMP domain-containing sensor histidine kinase [Bacillaceae bacterium IKA-2]
MNGPLLEYHKQNTFKIQNQANEAEKLRVISELAASVSHEVRNPLTVTKGFLQLLRDDDISEKKQKEYLDLSLLELDRAQEIINNYLIYAKPSPQNNKEKLAILEEINYLIKVMTPYALMRGVEIIADAKEEGFIVGDRQKFRQSIINIIKNGIEAMPVGGILVLRAENTSKKIVVSITDYGVGMSSQKIAQLGLPIFSKKIQGTGLGTMVAFSIIKSMDATIDVESEIDRGTTFFITYPKINQLALGE